MKKAIFVTAFSAIAVLFAHAQKIEAAKIPAAVKSAFEKKYPGAVAKWELEDGKYEAVFKEGKTEAAATFKADGTFEEAETEITVTGLPASVVAYMKKNYNKPIKEASKIVLANGAVNYEAVIGKTAYVFDAGGNFIKQQKD